MVLNFSSMHIKLLSRAFVFEVNLFDFLIYVKHFHFVDLIFYSTTHKLWMVFVPNSPIPLPARLLKFWEGWEENHNIAELFAYTGAVLKKVEENSTMCFVVRVEIRLKGII